MPKYEVTAVDDQLVYDAKRQLVNGKRVYFYMPEYNETHFVDVVNMNETTVKKAIEDEVAKRNKLATLSGDVK